MQLKADASSVPSRDDLESLSHMIMHSTGVQMDALRDMLHGKADASKVVTEAQLEEMSASLKKALVNNKVDLAQYLVSETKQAAGAVEEILKQRLAMEALVAGKRHAAVEDALGKKADKSWTASRKDVENLAALLKRKAGTSSGLSAQEVRAMLAPVEVALRGKADAEDSVSRRELEEVRSMLAPVEVALRGKADANDSVCRRELEEVQAVLAGKADIDTVASREQLELVKAAVDGKADAGSVATAEEMHALRVSFNLKINASKAALQQELEEAKVAIGKNAQLEADATVATARHTCFQDQRQESVKLAAKADHARADVAFARALDVEVDGARALLRRPSDFGNEPMSPNPSLLKRRRGPSPGTPGACPGTPGRCPGTPGRLAPNTPGLWR